MNKIKVEQSNLFLKQQEVYLEKIEQEYLQLSVTGVVRCTITDIPKKWDLLILLEKDSCLDLDFDLKMMDSDVTIRVVYQDSATLHLNYACTYEGENQLLLDNQVNANYTNSEVRIRAVEKSGSMVIKAEGKIFKQTIENNYLEDVKAITNENHSIKIMPNLLVETNSVLANHNATISYIKTSDLFYLTSRGIAESHAKELIKEGFLKGILKNNVN